MSPGEFHRSLVGLSPTVPPKHHLIEVAGSQLAQFLRKLDKIAVVKVGVREMHEFVQLILGRFHNFSMRRTSVENCYSRREIYELVTINITYNRTMSRFYNKWIDPLERRRRISLRPFDNTSSLFTWWGDNYLRELLPRQKVRPCSAFQL